MSFSLSFGGSFSFVSAEAGSGGEEEVTEVVRVAGTDGVTEELVASGGDVDGSNEEKEEGVAADGFGAGADTDEGADGEEVEGGADFLRIVIVRTTRVASDRDGAEA